MINFYGLSNIFAAITNTLIALFVYTKGGGTRLSKIWSVFASAVAVYALGAYLASGAQNATEAFFWWRFSYVGVILLPVLFMHFVYAFLDIERSRGLALAYAVTGIIWVANLLSKELFIGNVSLLFTDSNYFTPAWWVYPPGPLHILYVLGLYIGLLSFLLFKLVREYTRTKGVKRKQIGYFFIAMTFGFIGGGTSYLPCFGLEIYPVLNITVPLYTFIIAYAIIRHKLMDIRIIIKKTIVFGGLFVVAYAIFTILASLGMLFYEQLGQNRWMAMLPSIFMIVLVLRPLDRVLRNITDRYLFQKKYDYKHLLRTFTDEVITVLGLDELLRLTVDKLMDIIRLENISIFLYDEVSKTYKVMESSPEDFRVGKKVLDTSDRAVAYMERTWNCLAKSDLESKSLQLSQAIAELLDHLSADLVIPIVARGKMAGILALGPKKSDELFAEDDIDILLPLAKTLSIAITNAQLFEQLSEAQAQAAQREKMAVIGTLSAGINHEICNPLGISRGQCEMFLLNLKEGFYDDKSTDELLEKAKSIMEKVINETDRATVITRKLSSFAKPAKGEVVENVNVNEELEQVLSLVEHDMKLDNIHVKREFCHDIAVITADAKQLQEIFFNIIRNAAQAIGRDGEVTVKTSNAGADVLVEVRDTGPGINKGAMDKIFDPFFTTKDPGKGTGLGLFIVKQIIEKNNGRIDVESQKDVGTVFRLVFPATCTESTGALGAERAA